MTDNERIEMIIESESVETKVKLSEIEHPLGTTEKACLAYYQMKLEKIREEIRKVLDAYKGDGAKARPGFSYGLKLADKIVENEQKADMRDCGTCEHYKTKQMEGYNRDGCELWECEYKAK